MMLASTVSPCWLRPAGRCWPLHSLTLLATACRTVLASTQSHLAGYGLQDGAGLYTVSPCWLRPAGRCWPLHSLTLLATACRTVLVSTQSHLAGYSLQDGAGLVLVLLLCQLEGSLPSVGLGQVAAARPHQHLHHTSVALPGRYVQCCQAMLEEGEGG